MGTFFRKEDFLVEVSLDGFPDLHNANRIDADGKATWNCITQNLEFLKKQKVRFNVLCVVTEQCALTPLKVYKSLKKLGFEYLQFIACIDPIGEPRGMRPWSLKPETYGKFLCQLFDLWYQDWECGQYHSIRLFDDYIHLLLGDGGGTCSTCGQCGAYFVVESDGSVYPCDFFSLDDWKLGQFSKNSLKEMSENDTAKRFFTWGREKPTECLSCSWRVLCNGGCKNDWITAKDGFHNYYCQSFKMLFAYAAPRMLNIARAEYIERYRLYHI